MRNEVMPYDFSPRLLPSLFMVDLWTHARIIRGMERTGLSDVYGKAQARFADGLDQCSGTMNLNDERFLKGILDPLRNMMNMEWIVLPADDPARTMRGNRVTFTEMQLAQNLDTAVGQRAAKAILNKLMRYYNDLQQGEVYQSGIALEKQAIEDLNMGLYGCIRYLENLNPQKKRA